MDHLGCYILFSIMIEPSWVVKAFSMAPYLDLAQSICNTDCLQVIY